VSISALTRPGCSVISQCPDSTLTTCMENTQYVRTHAMNQHSQRQVFGTHLIESIRVIVGLIYNI
jgi:hypothetical protein